MAPSPLDKQTSSCNSPHDWLIYLAMDLAVLYDGYVEVNMVPMDTNGCHLAVFSVDV